MPFQRGEDVNIGVAIESSRGTLNDTPGVWIPGRTPAGVIAMLDKVDVAETRSTKMSSQGSEITQKRSGGNLEFNLRVSSLGYLLKSLLGNVTTSTLETGVYQHIFSILASNPQHPSLSLHLSKPQIQSYSYVNALVKSLEIRTPVDDLVNGTVEFLATAEAEHAAYSPSFSSNDYYFRHQDLTVKIASAMAGLAGATPIKVNDFSVSIDNGARTNQQVGNLSPSDVLATVIAVEGDLELDLTDKSLYDLFRAGTYQAFRIQGVRSDITIGAVNNPTFILDLPKISFEGFDEDRKIDDIVTQKLKFKAHYSLADALGIQVTLKNEKANYTT